MNFYHFSTSSLHPFGSIMPNSAQNLGAGTYRYGMNGMEQDKEWTSNGGSHYTSYWRQYDPRLGRWMSDEPKPVAWESGYAAFRNNPIYFADPTGDWPKIGQWLKKAVQSIKEFIKHPIDASKRAKYFNSGTSQGSSKPKPKGGEKPTPSPSPKPEKNIVVPTTGIDGVGVLLDVVTINGNYEPPSRAINYPSGVDWEIQPGDATVSLIGALIEDVMFSWTQDASNAIRISADDNISSSEKISAWLPIVMMTRGGGRVPARMAPTKISIGTQIDIKEFNMKQGQKMIHKKSNWYIEKDNLGDKSHGGSAYKLFDKKGKRQWTLDKEGEVLRK